MEEDIPSSLIPLFKERQKEFTDSLQRAIYSASSDKYLKQMFQDSTSALFVPNRISEIIYQILTDDREEFIQELVSQVHAIEACFGPVQARRIIQIGNKLAKIANDSSRKESEQRGCIRLLRDQLNTFLSQPSLESPQELSILRITPDLSEVRRILTLLKFSSVDINSYVEAFITATISLIQKSKMKSIKILTKALKDNARLRRQLQSAFSRTEETKFSSSLTSGSPVKHSNTASFSESLSNRSRYGATEVAKLCRSPNAKETLSTALIDAQRQIDEHVGSIRELEQQRSSILEESELKDQQISQLSQKNEQAKTELQQEKRKNAKLSRQIEKFSGISEENSTLRLKLNETYSQMDELESLKEENATLRRTLRRQQKTISELQDIQIEYTRLQAHSEAVKVDLTNMSSELEQTASKLEVATSENLAAQRKVAELRKLKQEKETISETARFLNQSLRDEENKSADLTQKCEQLQQKVQSLQTEVRRLKSVEELWKAAHEQNQSLVGDLAKSQSENASLQRASGENRSLREAYTRQNAELASLRPLKPIVDQTMALINASTPEELPKLSETILNDQATLEQIKSIVGPDPLRTVTSMKLQNDKYREIFAAKTPDELKMMVELSDKKTAAVEEKISTLTHAMGCSFDEMADEISKMKEENARLTTLEKNLISKSNNPLQKLTEIAEIEDKIDIPLADIVNEYQLTRNELMKTALIKSKPLHEIAQSLVKTIQESRQVLGSSNIVARSKDLVALETSLSELLQGGDINESVKKLVAQNQSTSKLLYEISNALPKEMSGSIHEQIREVVLDRSKLLKASNNVIVSLAVKEINQAMETQSDLLETLDTNSPQAARELVRKLHRDFQAISQIVQATDYVSVINELQKLRDSLQSELQTANIIEAVTDLHSTVEKLKRILHTEEIEDEVQSLTRMKDKIIAQYPECTTNDAIIMKIVESKSRSNELSSVISMVQGTNQDAVGQVQKLLNEKSDLSAELNSLYSAAGTKDNNVIAKNRNILSSLCTDLGVNEDQIVVSVRQRLRIETELAHLLDEQPIVETVRQMKEQLQKCFDLTKVDNIEDFTAREVALNKAINFLKSTSPTAFTSTVIALSTQQKHLEVILQTNEIEDEVTHLLQRSQFLEKVESEFATKQIIEEIRALKEKAKKADKVALLAGSKDLSTLFSKVQEDHDIFDRLTSMTGAVSYEDLPESVSSIIQQNELLEAEFDKIVQSIPTADEDSISTQVQSIMSSNSQLEEELSHLLKWTGSPSTSALAKKYREIEQRERELCSIFGVDDPSNIATAVLKTTSELESLRQQESAMKEIIPGNESDTLSTRVYDLVSRKKTAPTNRADDELMKVRALFGPNPLAAVQKLMDAERQLNELQEMAGDDDLVVNNEKVIVASVKSTVKARKDSEIVPKVQEYVQRYEELSQTSQELCRQMNAANARDLKVKLQQFKNQLDEIKEILGARTLDEIAPKLRKKEELIEQIAQDNQQIEEAVGPMRTGSVVDDVEISLEGIKDIEALMKMMGKASPKEALEAAEAMKTREGQVARSLKSSRANLPKAAIAHAQKAEQLDQLTNTAGCSPEELKDFIKGIGNIEEFLKGIDENGSGDAKGVIELMKSWKDFAKQLLEVMVKTGCKLPETARQRAAIISMARKAIDELEGWRQAAQSVIEMSMKWGYCGKSLEEAVDAIVEGKKGEMIQDQLERMEKELRSVREIQQKERAKQEERKVQLQMKVEELRQEVASKNALKDEIINVLRGDEGDEQILSAGLSEEELDVLDEHKAK